MKKKTEDTVKAIQHDIQSLMKNPENVKDYSRFFKNKEKFITLTSQNIRQLAKDHYKNIRDLDKEHILDICDKLLELRDKNATHIAFDWAFRVKKHYDEEDFVRFERWVETYVDDWSSCDDLCTHPLGYIVWKFPEKIHYLYKWTSSKNLWMRRASAVSLIYSVRKNENTGEAFKIADLLLTDTEDLVQKGYGWLLKETTKHREEQVFEYVMKKKKQMPRTALRYAIEKMPPGMKQQAMS